MRDSLICGVVFVGGFLLFKLFATPTQNQVEQNQAKNAKNVLNRNLADTGFNWGRFLHLTPTERLLSLTQWAKITSHVDFLESVENLKETSLTELEWRVLLTRWVECDPGRFAKNARKLIQDGKPFNQETIYQILAEGAFKQALTLTPLDVDALFLYGNVDDPKGILDWLDSTGHEDRTALLPSIYKAWINQDRVKALESIDEISDSYLHNRMLAVAAGEWANVDPDGAIKWVLEKSKDKPEIQETLLRAVFDSVQEFDPEKAWNILKADENALPIKAGSRLFEHLKGIIGRAAYKNPGEVLGWISRLEDPELQREIIDSTSALNIHFEDLEKDIQQLPVGEIRERFAAQVISQRHSSVADRIAAVKFLEGVDQDRLLANVLGSSGLQFTDVANQIDDWKHLPANARSKIMENIKFWTAEDPSAAAMWLATLPENLATPDQFSKTWRQWTQLEPKAASQAIGDLSPGSHRDAAIIGLIEEIALGPHTVRPDFEAAWKWAQTIEDRSSRSNLATQLASEWREFDSDAAAEHLNP